MKQATQLQIQWQDVPVAEPSVIDYMELCAVQTVTRTLPSLVLFAKVAATVAFSFGLMFVAAIIGG